MQIPRLYVEATPRPDSELVLADERAHYLSRVLRRQVGEALVLFDGRGTRVSADVIAIERRSVRLRVGSSLVYSLPNPAPITLGVALLKGDALDDVLQQATQLDVDVIQLLTAERCEGRLPDDGARARRRFEHWRGVLTSACEQCGRDWLPELLVPVTVNAWRPPGAGLRWLLDPGATTRIGRFAGRAQQPIALAIGPEGGWTDAEVRAAHASGFTPVALGTPVLRAATAPMAALAMIALMRQLPNQAEGEGTDGSD